MPGGKNPQLAGREWQNPTSTIKAKTSTLSPRFCQFPLPFLLQIQNYEPCGCSPTDSSRLTLHLTLTASSQGQKHIETKTHLTSKPRSISINWLPRDLMKASFPPERPQLCDASRWELQTELKGHYICPQGKAAAGSAGWSRGSRQPHAEDRRGKGKKCILPSLGAVSVQQCICLPPLPT